MVWRYCVQKNMLKYYCSPGHRTQELALYNVVVANQHSRGALLYSSECSYIQRGAYRPEILVCTLVRV